MASVAAVFAFAAVATLAFAAPAGAADRKLAPDLLDTIRGGQSTGPVRVIIQYEDSASPADEDNVRRRGGSPGKRLGLVRAIAAELPVSEIEDLSNDPRIFRISPDRSVRATTGPASPGTGVGLYRSFPALTGAGVSIAVIDSGIAPQEDLPSLAGYIDFIQPNAPRSQDPFGHGTHVGGIIGARRHPAPDGSGLEFGGVAPDARIISLRVLDRWGHGRASDVIEAIGWAVANKDTYGIRILNLSLGHQVAEPVEMDPLAEACANAWEAGLVVVASAGNLGLSGNGTITSPGNSPRILTVGAMDDRGTIDAADDAFAAFSSQGPTIFDLVVKPDLLAPGFRIASLRSAHSSLDVSHPEARVSLGDGPAGAAREPRYFEMSGSSMAAAFVSGMAALMIEADPALTPDTIKARLMATARRMDEATLFQRGAGSADVEAAIAGHGTAAAAVSPAVYLDDVDVIVEDPFPSWGGTGAWSLEALYGDPLFWREDDIWTSGFLDDPCVTGNGLVWQGKSGSGLTGEGLVWQGKSADITGEGLVWQGKKGDITGSGLVWQGLTADIACTSTAGLLWQGTLAAQGGLVWQGGDVSSEGLVWQGRK